MGVFGIASTGDLLEDGLEDTRILGSLRIVAEQQIREEPLPEQRPLFADQLVEGHADLVRKPHVKVMAVDGNALGFEQRREGTELDRRIFRKAEGHVDERYLRLAGRMPAAIRLVTHAVFTRVPSLETAQIPGQPSPRGKNHSRSSR